MPIAPARLAVTMAARALPTRQDRERYSAEFIAELHGLPIGVQCRLTVGVLSQVLALRTALGPSPTRSEEDAMPELTHFHRTFRCRALRLHHWRTVRNPHGEAYRHPWGDVQPPWPTPGAVI